MFRLIDGEEESCILVSFWGETRWRDALERRVGWSACGLIGTSCMFLVVWNELVSWMPNLVQFGGRSTRCGFVDAMIGCSFMWTSSAHTCVRSSSCRCSQSAARSSALVSFLRARAAFLSASLLSPSKSGSAPRAAAHAVGGQLREATKRPNLRPEPFLARAQLRAKCAGSTHESTQHRASVRISPLARGEGEASIGFVRPSL